MPIEAAISRAEHSDFSKWFPQNASLGIKFPALRIICIHGAGMEQQVFIGRGTQRSPQSNLLLDFCLENKVELLSAQLPGRAMRHKEDSCSSAKEVSEKLLSVLKSRICANESYVICAHSMGCLCAYELLHLIKKLKLPLPLHVFFSCMISPDTPDNFKPWKKSKELDETEFKDEIRGWHVNEIVFEPSMWKTYESLFRKDFIIFDEYVFTHKNEPSIGVNATCFYAKDDKRVTQDLMKSWEKLLSEGTSNNDKSFSFQLKCIEGTHAFLYSAKERERWMKEVINVLEKILFELNSASGF